MIVEELHFKFKQRANKNYTNFNKGASDAEIDSYLNDAVNEYVDMFAFGRNDKKYKVGFEVTTQRIDMLSTLVVGFPDQPLVVPIVHGNDVYEFKFNDLKYPYRHYVRAYLPAKECNYSINVAIEQSGDMNTVLNDLNRKPSLVWRRAVGHIRNSSDNTGSSLYVYTNGEFTPVGLYLEYIKQPAKIALGTYNGIPTTTNPSPGLVSKTECDLPENYHDLLVDIAVQMYGRTLEDVNKVNLFQQRTVDRAS